MINLQKKLQMKKTVITNNVTPDSRISVRDKLLVKGRCINTPYLWQAVYFLLLELQFQPHAYVLSITRGT